MRSSRSELRHLDAISSDVAPTYERAAKLPRRNLGELPRGGERILVVDDNWAILSCTRRILEALGYEVEVVDRPLKAIALLERNSHRPVDLVLTDYEMPEMNGYELTQRIGRLSPQPRVILSSAWDERFIVPDERPSNWPPFLAKPLTVEKLALKLREVLETPSGAISGSFACADPEFDAQSPLASDVVASLPQTQTA